MPLSTWMDRQDNVWFISFEPWIKPSRFVKERKKQQNRQHRQPTRDSTGNKYEHKHETWLVHHFTASGSLYPPATDLESRTDHRHHLSDLPPKVCHRPTCRGIAYWSPEHIYIGNNLPCWKHVVLTHKQVIKNPSYPQGVVPVSNLSYAIICVLQLAQVHVVSTFSYSISLHLLLQNWRALYVLSSTKTCKIQPST